MGKALADVAGADTVPDRYTEDFYSWTQREAEMLKLGRFEHVDIVNVIEEIETSGRSEASALESAYRLICMHQLERIVQPERADSESWTRTIVRERLNAARLLEDNPGLKPRRGALFARAYAHARKEAAIETRLPLNALPEAAPFSFEEITDESFWAGPAKPITAR